MTDHTDHDRRRRRSRAATCWPSTATTAGGWSSSWARSPSASVLAWVVEPAGRLGDRRPADPRGGQRRDRAASSTRPGSATARRAYAVDLVDPSAGQRLLDLVPGVLGAVLVVLACWCIVLLLRTVAAGDPFDPVNVIRLRVVAAALVLGVPVVYVLQVVRRRRWCSRPSTSAAWSRRSRLDIPWVPMLAGLVVAMLAEAFKAGSRLRDDVDGLV